MEYLETKYKTYKLPTEIGTKAKEDPKLGHNSPTLTKGELGDHPVRLNWV